MDLLGVVAHYINVNYNHQTVLLALRPTYGSHTGDNIAECLLSVIQEFVIGTKISYFRTDGASNNDAAIDALSTDLDVLPYRQRLRYAAHIINLVYKAILLGADVDYIKDACDNTTLALNETDAVDTTIQRFESDVRSEKDALTAWRKKGPIGKLHNLVRYVQASPAHRCFFESKQKEVDPTLPVYKLVTNSGIRWNSTHDIVERALQLKDALELYQSHYRSDDTLINDVLNSDDWLELRELRDLLHPMKTSSVNIQANPAHGYHGAL